ncbi:unnamed protein product [Plasmodium vivax]|uniref:(malaria parasite P. vivax) hypothetical protein n=1 Tax=Plasmodium vivax TaxID=5855 RepID=A0A8S4HFT3_PLAVI|nr:unnamed protein product [Plasmodium vivax]
MKISKMKRSFSFLNFIKIIIYSFLFWTCYYHSDYTYIGTKEIKSNLDVSLNLRNCRLLTKHEIENESIYDQMKESDVWKKRSYKIKKNKEPKEHNVFGSIHFYGEKKIFDRLNEMENMINDKNRSRSKYYWKVLKIFGPFCILPIVIGASASPFTEKNDTNTNIICGLLVPVVIILLIVIYISLINIKYHYLKNKNNKNIP